MVAAVKRAVHLRPANLDDLPAINDIYNHYVRHSTCTYQEAEETPASRRAWFERHGPAHPVIVAVADGQVVGWGSLSPYHARSAYRFTAENSVYVRHDSLRCGIGTALLTELINHARRLGYHSIIAGIDSNQPGSIAAHQRIGFIHAGVIRQVGFKFGRWLDVCYMQLLLAQASPYSD